MKVYERKTGKEFEVYDICYNKSGYPEFLIYDSGWLVKSAAYFRPVKEREGELK